MSKHLKIVSSQYKHVAGRKETDLPEREISYATTLRNEPFSFQVLYWIECDHVTFQPVSIAVECEGLPLATYRVDPVSVTHAANTYHEPGYEGDEAGLYPDVLLERPASPRIDKYSFAFGNCMFEGETNYFLNAMEYDLQSLWITANPDSIPMDAGTKRIKITMTSLKTGEIVDTAEFTLEIINALLPEQKAYYTNWIYEDAVCDMHNVELYSQEFYEVFDEYLKNAAKHRQNTILLPAFTPPLDTPIGKERLNVQLVDLQKKGTEWVFGFERMKEFIDHAKACGITYFEHSHLFYQWGAKNAPNIYNTDGKRIFGYETDAMGDEYQGFLKAYLKHFLEFAKSENIYDKLVFHISDEPNLSHMESYSKAVKSVEEFLKHFPVADALSEVSYYTNGLVKNPIAFIDRADEFDDMKAPFWVYYTGGPHHQRATNRLVTNTAARTRILGIQMYRYKALGFLHWGYNYFYDRLTAGIFDPRANACGYKQFPGAAHLVYPVHVKGECPVAPSIREKNMAEAMDDLRALELLETYIGRESVLSFCEKILGEEITNKTIPEKDQLFTLRQKVNEEIKQFC